MMAPLRKIQDQGIPLPQKMGYMRGQGGMGGETRKERRKRRAWQPRWLSSLDPLTQGKGKERLLSFLSETH